MDIFGPDWWHHHGVEMVVNKLDERNRLLIIKGNAAEVGIILVDSLPEKPWRVQWEIVSSYREKVIGIIFFTAEELRAAFGFATNLKTSTKDGVFLGRFRADSAIQGKFIRAGSYLNIPCPGTGHNGDPNISIKIDDQIRDAIEKIMAD